MLEDICNLNSQTDCYQWARPSIKGCSDNHKPKYFKLTNIIPKMKFDSKKFPVQNVVRELSFQRFYGMQ